jgi:hypothetical protein
MAHEYRQVILEWQHPRDQSGAYLPLWDGKQLAGDQSQYELGKSKWAEGLYLRHFAYTTTKPPTWAPRDGVSPLNLTWEEWAGPPPNPEHYMPVWSPEEALYYQDYEVSTFNPGTPFGEILPLPVTAE